MIADGRERPRRGRVKAMQTKRGRLSPSPLEAGSELVIVGYGVTLALVLVEPLNLHGVPRNAASSCRHALSGISDVLRRV